MKSKFLVLLFSLATFAVFATERPTPAEIERYKQDGSYQKRAEFVQKVGNHRVRQDVAARMLARLHAAANPDGPSQAPLPGWKGMPTKGTNKVLVLLIDFPDYSHVNESSLVTDKLFGAGKPAEFPHDSLRNYYRRSSYNQLEIQGSALGWYRMQHERSWYTTTYKDDNTANRAIIDEALESFDAEHDFSQYDNDHNGEVDYFAVIWAGPDTGWGNFWWGYQWDLFNPITRDGVRFKTFSWQWESNPVGNEFTPDTIIHETGHALGVPDYYDYDPSVGPDGGVGGLDIMHGDDSDHNAFSKYMLEWLEPVRFSSGSTNIALRAMGGAPEALIAMPNLIPGTPYTEYFLIENRTKTNNDAHNFGDGVVIWHVDATPNARGDDFLYDNSYTKHKLLRLMEADGLEEIEKGGWGDAGDYWNKGETFGPTSRPNSRDYTGSDTGLTVDNISANGPSMTVQVSIDPSVSAPRIHRSPDSFSIFAAEGSDVPAQEFILWATKATLKYAISDDATWLSVSPDSGTVSSQVITNKITYDITDLVPGTYTANITITAPGATNSPQTIEVSLKVMGMNIGKAVDNTNVTWKVGGSGLDSFWFDQSTVTHDQEDAAQSGPLGNGQTNYIQTTVEGPGVVSFWWKVSSEAHYDFLRFSVDGTEVVPRISGATEWQRVHWAIEPGSHQLRWAYTKDVTIASGADAAWVDQVEYIPGNVPPSILTTNAITQLALVGQKAGQQTFRIENGGAGTLTYSLACDVSWMTVTPENEVSTFSPNTHTIIYNNATLPPGTYKGNIAITASGATNSPTVVPVTLNIIESSGALAEAVDFTSSVWNTGGSSGWLPATSTTHDGVDAASSGDITHSQSSWMETAVEGPGTVSFWWKVSSEPSYDFLALLVDGQKSGLRIDGEVDWQQGSIEVPAGAHTVRWEYKKDSSQDGGADTAWVDFVTFVRGGNGTDAVLSENFSSGLPSGWQIVDNANTGAIWSINNGSTIPNLTGGSDGYAIADSDHYGEKAMNTELITPVMSFAGYTNVVLEFKSDFAVFSTETADVDYRINGGAWMNIWRRSTDDYGPKTYKVSLPSANNQASVQLRFHYYNAFWGLFWGVDDVTVTGVSTTAPQRDYVAQWRQVWDRFDRNYALFAQKAVNWNPVYEGNRGSFSGVGSDAAFAAQLNQTLQVLKDWQVCVKAPGGALLGYSGTITNNSPAQPFTFYTSGAAYSNLKSANAIKHAWVWGTIAHIIVSTLEDSNWSSITDADLDTLLQQYQGAEGLILDLRANTGGNVGNALRLASRFTDLPRVYGYTRTRTQGTDHAAFGEFTPRMMEPSTGVHFTNNVVCLVGHKTMGGGEWLALMMKTCPQATLAGDRTRGAAGTTETYQTPLGVEYTVPRELAYNSDQVTIQDSGIVPAILLAAGEGSFSQSQQRDYVLERGVALLRKPTISARPVVSVKGVALDWHGAIGSTYTLLRSTSLQPGSWTLAPGALANRPGTGSTMSYTNSAAGSQQFFRIQVGP